MFLDHILLTCLQPTLLGTEPHPSASTRRTPNSCHPSILPHTHLHQHESTCLARWPYHSSSSLRTLSHLPTLELLARLAHQSIDSTLPHTELHSETECIP